MQVHHPIHLLAIITTFALLLRYSTAAFAPGDKTAVVMMNRSVVYSKRNKASSPKTKTANHQLHAFVDDIEHSHTTTESISTACSLLCATTGITLISPTENLQESSESLSPQLVALSDQAQSAMYDSEIQSSIMTNLAHVVDFIALLDPEIPLLRTASLLGRIFSISADYIPDHSIAANEAAFQGPMLVISAALFIRSIFPVLMSGVSSITTVAFGRGMHSSSRTSTWRNNYAFQHLFDPAGISKLQFRSLTNIGAIDWIRAPPYIALISAEEEPEYLYWVYRGSVELSLNGDGSDEESNNYSVNYVQCDAHKGPEFIGFLADMKFQCHLEMKKRRKTKRGTSNKTGDLPASCTYPQVKITAGPTGARLMRVNKQKLSELMKYDDGLASSIHRLMVKGMQQELESLLASACENAQIKIATNPSMPADEDVDELCNIEDLFL